MSARITLSPETLATTTVPEHVKTVDIVDREQWLALREPLVTASVAAALFGDGVHPYQSAYALWAAKSGLIPASVPETPAMKRGRLMEPVLLEMLREEFPTWAIVQCRKFYADGSARLGATPDFLAIRPDKPGLGIIQGKSAGKFAFKKGWRGEDGDVEIPLWIAVQANTEAHLTGASWACVAVVELGDGGLDLHVEDVPLSVSLMAKMRERAIDFWDRVEDARPYPPDYNKDAGLIAAIYDRADEPEIALAGAEIAKAVDRREKLKETEAEGVKAAKERKAIDGLLNYALGNSSRGKLTDGRLVVKSIVKREAYSVKASQYTTIKTVGTASAVNQGEAA